MAILDGFGNKIDQDIVRRRSVCVEDWLPDEEISANIAVFCGTNEQRCLTVEQVIARSLGKMGVLVLHSNDLLEADLQNFPNIYPDVWEMYPNLPVCHVNSRHLVYEPLYGMDKNRAAEAIYPEVSRDSPMYLQQHLCSEALRQYMEILSRRQLPIDLDSLCRLVSMDLSELQEGELSTLPEKVQGEILAALSQENIFRQVRADVGSFAAQMDGRIWNRQTEPTDISMVEAVKNRALLSIRIPVDNTYIMDYLAAELKYLAERQEPFLLVADSIGLAGSALKNLLIHPGKGYVTAIAARDVGQMLGDAADSALSLLGSADQIIVYNCANVRVASQYTELVGEYLRRFVDEQQSVQRAPFAIFGSHGKGNSIREGLYARIRPEELTRLGAGAMLIDQRRGRVELAGKVV